MNHDSRIVIAGGPRVGKTTLAAILSHEMSIAARSTDGLIGRASFKDSAHQVVTWMEAPGPWIIEGVQSARALRAWLTGHRDGLPCDLIFWSNEAKVDRTARQEAFAKGIGTVWAEILPVLRRRSAAIHRFPSHKHNTQQNRKPK